MLIGNLECVSGGREARSGGSRYWMMKDAPIVYVEDDMEENSNSAKSRVTVVFLTRQRNNGIATLKTPPNRERKPSISMITSIGNCN